MLRLKLGGILYDKHMNANQLSKLTGIRYPTVLDMAENKSKVWSPENLGKIMVALKIENISDLIEWIDEDKEGEKSE